MTVTASLALATGLLAYAAASGAFVGHLLAPPIRAAGQRRTWGRGLIRTRLPDHPRTQTARTEEA